MNKKTEAELLIAQSRMAAQRAAVTELLVKTGCTKIQLQQKVNRALARSGSDVQITEKSYFAKKFAGNRSGFRGAIEAALQRLCEKHGIPWHLSYSPMLKVMRLAAKERMVQPSDWIATRAEISAEELRSRRNDVLRRAIEISLHLPASIEAAASIALHPHEFEDVARSVGLRADIFTTVEIILNIPRRYREYHDVDCDPEWELSQDPYYAHLRQIEAKALPKAKNKKVAKK